MESGVGKIYIFNEMHLLQLALLNWSHLFLECIVGTALLCFSAFFLATLTSTCPFVYSVLIYLLDFKALLYVALYECLPHAINVNVNV